MYTSALVRMAVRPDFSIALFLSFDNITVKIQYAEYDNISKLNMEVKTELVVEP